MRIAMSIVLAGIAICAAALLFVSGRPVHSPPNRVIATVPAPAPTTLPKPTSEPPKPAPLSNPPDQRAPWDDVERKVLELTNQARAEANLKPLDPEDTLRETARAQSADMIERHFFDHVNPSGEDPADRIAAKHRRLIGTVGENIWKGSGESYLSDPKLAAVIVDAWMHSPGHRANILRPEFTHLGVGVVMRGIEVRATQNFGRARAYLDHPLPERVAAGSSIDLASGGVPPAAEMFDLRDFQDSRPASQPAPVADARLIRKPGTYRLRLYFPTGEHKFAIFSGPLIQIE